MKNHIFLIIGLGLLTLSCTRSLESDTTLNFNFSNLQNPSSSSVSEFYYPEHIIVNIKYDNQNFFYEWECEFDDGLEHLCVLPSNLNFSGVTFPGGSNRLIQTLLVYANEDDQYEFFYADKIVSFSGGLLNVTIGNTGWNKQISSGESQFAGRFFRGISPAGDLTGILEGFYNPSNGAPRMKVTDEYIYAGWFDLMMFQGIPLTYAFKPTGENIIVNKSFTNLVTLKAADQDSKAVHLSAPSYKTYYHHTELIAGSYLAATEFNADMPEWKFAGSNLSSVGVIDGTPLNDLGVTDENFRSVLFSSDGSGSFITSNSGEVILGIDFVGYEFNFEKVVIQAKNSSVGAIARIDFENFVPELLGFIEIGANVTTFQEQSESLFDYKDASSLFRVSLPNAPFDEVGISDIKIYRKVFKVEEEPAQEHIYAMYDITTQDFLPDNSGDDGVGWSGTSFVLLSAINSDFSLDYDEITGTIINYAELNPANESNFVDWNPATCASSTVELCFPSASSFPTNGECTTDDINASCFNILPKRLTHESLMPMDGPFALKETVGGYAPVKIFNCDTDCDIEAFLVPGLVPAEYGYTLLKMPANFEYDHDDVNCESLLTQASAHQEVDIGNYPSAVFLSMGTGGQLLACPYKKGSPKKYLPHISHVSFDPTP